MLTAAMSPADTVARCSIGDKAVLADTGAIGSSFVVAHVLESSRGVHRQRRRRRLPRVAAPRRQVRPQSQPVPVMQRSVLLAALVLHIDGAYQLARQ
jgi:hypothetical protein